MRNELLAKISEEEYEQVRQAGKVLQDFLNKYYYDHYYDEIIISKLGSMEFRRNYMEFLWLDKTREEDRQDREKLLSEVPF